MNLIWQQWTSTNTLLNKVNTFYLLALRIDFLSAFCVCVLKGKTVVIQHDLASLSVHVQEQRCDESVSFGCFPPQVTVVYSCDNY